MTERINELAEQAIEKIELGKTRYRQNHYRLVFNKKKFAELIVEECRNVVADVYRKTPLELCGPLLTADEEIAKHFYGIKE